MFEDRRLAPRLAIVGMCLAGLGVYFNFQLERHSFVSTNDLQFVFLEHAFLPTFVLGLLISSVSGAIWARQTSARYLIIVGVSLLFCVGGTGGDLVNFNVHTWTGSLSFLYAAGGFVGLLFVIVGLLRQRS